MNIKPTISGLGFYVPEKILTNADLEKMVDTTDEWITTRTGIKERHIAAPNEYTSDLAFEACTRALQSGNIEAKEITHIFIATFTPDFFCPNAACIVESKLGLSGLAAIDCNTACTGFIFALDMACAYSARDPNAVILVCAAENLTSRVNWEDRSTCVLFGDGAGAAVVTNNPQKKLACVKDIEVGSDGNLGNLLTVRGGGSAHPAKLGEIIDDEYFIKMAGPEVFKNAVRQMEQVCLKVLARNDLKPEDIDLIVPHQANWRIIDALRRKMNFPEEKVFVNVDRYGNTSCAAIIIALTEAYNTGRIAKGSKVMLTAFGGGFTWGATILEF